MKWDDIALQLSRATTILQGEVTAAAGVGTTAEVAIVEAILALDSSRDDQVATLGNAGNRLNFTSEGTIRPGELQQLDILEAIFFGANGLLEQLKKLPES